MKITAGFVIIHDNKIMLEHPTNQRWWGTYSIPKGEVEDGEDHLTAAIRETEEELGIKIDADEVNPDEKGCVDYTNAKGEIYKKVYYFIVEPVGELKIDKSKLQKEEIDWAGFLTKEDAKKRIYWRFKHLLDYLK